jgi:hypothetical protein
MNYHPRPPSRPLKPPKSVRELVTLFLDAWKRRDIVAVKALSRQLRSCGIDPERRRFEIARQSQGDAQLEAMVAGLKQDLAAKLAENDSYFPSRRWHPPFGSR